jgi:peroxiredoxin
MNTLNPDDLFPNMQLQLVGGGSLSLPDDLESPMTVVLFFRGHWWPYCRRLLAGFEERRAAFEEQGVSIIAGTVDPEEKLTDIAAGLGYPLAYGMTRADGDSIGAWWEERRDHIQPSEFVLSKSGKVMFDTYSNSPVGRMDPEETLTLTKYLNELRAKAKSGS